MLYIFLDHPIKFFIFLFVIWLASDFLSDVNRSTFKDLENDYEKEICKKIKEEFYKESARIKSDKERG